MIVLIENPEDVNKVSKYEPRKEEGAMESLMSGIKKFQTAYPDEVEDDKRNSIWIVSRQSYCEDEWSQVIKSLRVADQDIRHVKFTNSYVEHRLSEYWEEVKDMKNKSDVLAEKLNELSKIDLEFTRAASAFVSRCKDGDTRKVLFSSVARKSKSAECSMGNVHSSCLKVKQCRKTHRGEKLRRRKEYGKYCSICGVIEVPSGKSMIRCLDCQGEIIVRGQCSSCDSLGADKNLKKINGERLGKTCLRCNVPRKKLSMSDRKEFIKKIKPRLRLNGFFCKNGGKDYESSYCSECEFVSSCDLSVAGRTKRRNVSADSLFPRSDSDNQGVGLRCYSCDFDVSSSISSFDGDSGKSWLVPLVSSRIEQGDTSLDEEYATPREHLSGEDVRFKSEDSDVFHEAKLVEFSPEEFTDRTDSEEYAEAVEPADSNGVAVEQIIRIQQTGLDNVCDRLHRAEKALGDIAVGNLKLEKGILIMESISHENLELSMILRDIMTEMADRLNDIQNVKAAEDESESSEDFEEALDDLIETENFYDPQPPTHFYFCLECGIETFRQQLTNCPTCEGKLAEIPNGFPENSITESPSQSAGNALVPLPCISTNRKLNDAILSVFPAFVGVDFPLVSFTSVGDRLKLIERETNLLRDNNEIINLFVDDLKKKLQNELEHVQRLYVRKGDIGETTIVGIDFSFYQFTRHITERRMREERAVEKVQVRQKSKTFVEMKFEEVYKKEEQTALELQIFEERLEVEGLIIKETEDFLTCSNICEAEEETNSEFSRAPTFASEKFTTGERGDEEKDKLFISIEIEVEKDKKAIRCEYKANLQKRKLEEERAIPTITLYPVLAPSRSAMGRSSGESADVYERTRSDCELSNEPFFTDIERDDFVEIKSPKFFSVSSEDEDEEWNKEKKCKMGYAVAVEEMPVAIYPVTEITLSETPFAVLNVVSKKREFSRVSQIELSRLPESGLVILNIEAASPFSVINCDQDEPPEEFFEAVSHSDTSFREKKSSSISFKSTEKKSLLRFTPINVETSSVAIISLVDEALPIVITDEVKLVANVKNNSDFVPELATALSLIREIENDVVEVKLDNAIAILPQLESVLREHIQNKAKLLKEHSAMMSSTSIDVFMSTLSFIGDEREERETEVREMESYERLGKMLNLLTGLEEAVRGMSPNDYDRRDCEKRGRIHDLLQDLSARVEGVGRTDLDVSAVEETLELTSELEVAVRDYSSHLVQFQVKPETETVGDHVITHDNLKSMRKKIFENVALEAEERDSRIEEDIGRIRTLERENFEVMRFLDTLLDKTMTRVRELDEIRTRVMLFLGEIQEMAHKSVEEAPFVRGSGTKMMRTPTLPSITEVTSDCRTSSEEENMKETLNDMIVALDNLKTKAKQKTERYREIFPHDKDGTFRQIIDVQELEGKSSTSSEMGSEEDGGRSRITQFTRLGESTFFMTWSKPMQVDGESAIVGYEIWVNGKVNQRVRNPERLKAVLYSVRPSAATGEHRIRLFALTEDGRRLSLADLPHRSERVSDPHFHPVDSSPN